jgi:hypothetical protein
LEEAKKSSQEFRSSGVMEYWSDGVEEWGIHTLRPFLPPEATVSLTFLGYQPSISDLCDLFGLCAMLYP